MLIAVHADAGADVNGLGLAIRSQHTDAGIAGSDMVDITEFMLRYGAYNAANLDGGTSSGLVINGELVSKPVNGNGQKSTRAIPDAWIVTK